MTTSNVSLPSTQISVKIYFMRPILSNQNIFDLINIYLSFQEKNQITNFE